MRTLKGKWYWNEPVADLGKQNITIDQQITFTSNGKEWVGIRVSHQYVPEMPEEYQKNTVTFYGYDIDPSENVEVDYYMPQYGASGPGEWNDDGPEPSDIYRTIDFGTEPQEVSEEFYNFFIASARLISQTIAEKLQVVADNELKVYEAGYAKGNAEGVKEGIAEGKSAEYNSFWDNFQNYGNRRNYKGAFDGYAFNADTFFPKYDIIAEGNASQLMYAWNSNDNVMPKSPMDLQQRLIDCEVTLDTSRATNLNSIFSYSNITHIPTIDCSSLQNGEASGLFAHCWGFLKHIEKIIVHEGIIFKNWFINDGGLESVTIEGIIGQNGFDVSPCASLSHSSLMSIINALKDFTGEPDDEIGRASCRERV